MASGGRLAELAVAVRLAARCARLRLLPARRVATGDEWPRAVIVGAYGGDHIGDAAILGGVLLALHRDHGTVLATVMSHRPEHTARLAAGLATPVALQVNPYEPDEIEHALAGAQVLVFGGGPLMDLPLVLLRHLVAVAEARRRGVPVHVERVGLGPFRRAASRWAARRVLRAARCVSVRSRAAASDPLTANLCVGIGRDPAFDYLETRRSPDLATPEERASIDALLAGTEEQRLIGVNLRPIRHLWSRRGEAYSRAAYDAFLDRFAEGLAGVAAHERRPCFVFFAMNPIAFGLDDLDAARELERRLAGRAELRIWHADPGVDGMLLLLRRLDAAVTMRLHAAIFALSQQLPVLAIDYYPGHGGKVEQLFADLGRQGEACRIDAFEPDWLERGLRRALGDPGVKPRGEQP